MRNEKIFLTDDENVYIETLVPLKTKNYLRKALLVIPGGGYHNVCDDREGEHIAEAFIPYGFACFVLHYTVDRKKPYPAQLIEASLAIKHIKEHAEEYGIDPEAVFAVGFSAGGHLAGSLATMWHRPEVYDGTGIAYGENKIKGAMLIYPVIADQPFTFRNLLCTDEPTEEQLSYVRIDKAVDENTVPCYIMHTANDQVVPVRNALYMAAAMAEHNRPFALHVYPDGAHGVALANDITECGNPAWKKPEATLWVAQAAAWADALA